MPRRNSLGDLKIPAKISQAQISLRDLGRVRVFAGSVERKLPSLRLTEYSWNLTIIWIAELKDLQPTYYTLVAKVQAGIDTLQSVPSSDHAWERAFPSLTLFFHLLRPASRVRSNTNPPLVLPRKEAADECAIHYQLQVSNFVGVC